MTPMPSPAAQPEFPEGSLPLRPPAEASALHPSDLKDDRFPSGRRSLAKRAWLAFVRFLVTFGIGVGATLVWQSYGDAAREMIANSAPQLAWLGPQSPPVAENAADPIAPASSAAVAPDPQLNAVALDLEAVRQSVERIATSQEQLTRTVDQLAAGQEQMTRDIAKLHAIEQYILYKSSEAPPRPAPAAAPRPAARPAPAPAAQAPAAR